MFNSVGSFLLCSVQDLEHLDWNARTRIIMGTAYCLQHMHELNPPIPHFNLTSKEILLTEDYAAKVSRSITSIPSLCMKLYQECDFNSILNGKNAHFRLQMSGSGQILYPSQRILQKTSRSILNCPRSLTWKPMCTASES